MRISLELRFSSFALEGGDFDLFGLVLAVVAFNRFVVASFFVAADFFKTASKAFTIIWWRSLSTSHVGV